MSNHQRLVQSLSLRAQSMFRFAPVLLRLVLTKGSSLHCFCSNEHKICTFTIKTSWRLHITSGRFSCCWIVSILSNRFETNFSIWALTRLVGENDPRPSSLCPLPVSGGQRLAGVCFRLRPSDDTHCKVAEPGSRQTQMANVSEWGVFLSHAGKEWRKTWRPRGQRSVCGRPVLRYNQC